MDTTQNFNGLANVYATGRPFYATEFIDVLCSKYGVTGNPL